MDSRTLATYAHRGMVEKLSELQQRVVLRRALVAQFYDDALPPDPFMRSTIAGREALARAAEMNRDGEARDLERIAELTEAIRGMEAAFKAHKDASDAEWAQAMAEHLRQGMAR